MQTIVNYFMWVQLCQLQTAVRAYTCPVTVEDTLRHMHEALLYATGHTQWLVSEGDEGKRLVYERVYLPRHRWLRGALRAVVVGGVERGMTFLKQHPDAVAFDLWWLQQTESNITRPFEGDPELTWQ